MAIVYAIPEAQAWTSLRMEAVGKPIPANHASEINYCTIGQNENTGTVDQGEAEARLKDHARTTCNFNVRRELRGIQGYNA